MRKHLWLALFGLGALSGGLPVAAQSTADSGGVHRGFALELSVADIGIDQFEVQRVAIGVRPRWCPNPPWCWFIDFCWIPDPWPDPWPLIVFPGIRGDRLEVGPGLLVAPAVEYHFQPESRVRPALYLGAGVNYSGGQTVDLGAQGRLTTESDTSPAVIYGASLAYDLTPRTTFRFQAGASTAFNGELKVRDSNGRTATADGGSVTSPILGVSLSYNFGG
jgi:hypothetical protein